MIMIRRAHATCVLAAAILMLLFLCPAPPLLAQSPKLPKWTDCIPSDCAITTGKAVTEAALDANKKAIELASIKLDRPVDKLDMRDMVVYVRDTPENGVPNRAN